MYIQHQVAYVRSIPLDTLAVVHPACHMTNIAKAYSIPAVINVVF